MRYAIIADIHANLTALMAVLSDVTQREEIGEVWCLGDIIGYGPDPHQCIELLRRTKHICVAGNHDLAAIGEIDTSDFNPDAVTACEWTAKQLNVQDRIYIKSLPEVIERDDFILVHGSPRQPIWEYVLSISTARENFAYFQSKFCLVGHTHEPGIFKQDKGGSCSFSRFPTKKKKNEEEGLDLGEERLIINPGAVGQPRDGDPRASYAIYDSETKKISLYRVPYDIAATQARMVEQRLPIRLVARLSHGT
jgi:diadenosine tetraphosphatase ApaH/serine/threonine PP2A family protein phosphatase